MSYLAGKRVVAVVMNWIRSDIFLSSVAGVIYEPWQFSCVGNWMFNSAPDQDSMDAALVPTEDLLELT